MRNFVLFFSDLCFTKCVNKNSDVFLKSESNCIDECL